MAQRAGIFSFICFMFCASIILIEAGNWTEWRDITLCDAKPCGCPGDTKKSNGCKPGTKYQIRGCKVGTDGRACQYDDEGGPLREIKTCTNRGVCPGWSEFVPSECDPSDNRMAIKYCNNPPPIHEDIKCIRSTGEEGLEEENITACVYVAPATVATTAAPTVSTTPPLPCCNVTADSNDESDLFGMGTAQDASEDSYNYDYLECNQHCGDDEEGFGDYVGDNNDTLSDY